jgi:hypothetical protein
MKQDIYDLMLSRFITIYGDPKTDNAEAFLDEFASALEGFSPEIVSKAANKILRTHEYPTWPSLGECVKSCREVAWELNPPTKPEPARAIKKKHVGQDRVQALLKQAMGQGLNGDNDFEAIIARCPRGGSVDVSAPWGEEVRDRNGNVVPIRQRKGRAA